jgi:hypothetical protein
VVPLAAASGGCAQAGCFALYSSCPPSPHPTLPVARCLQARAAYDEAARGGGWWDSFSDNVACAWDSAKCRVKESLGMAAVSWR